MNILNNMKIATKIALGYFVVGGMLLVVIWVYYNSLESYQKKQVLYWMKLFPAFKKQLI